MTIAALETSSVVQTDRDGVRVLELSGPRLNTLALPLRTVLIQALDDAENDPAVAAVVLAGSHGTFSAGADLTEFDSGRGLAEPSLHATIHGFLDRMRTPVVAAIAGAALGGGFELALAAHYRVVVRGTALGLPETRFGFIPGAGGTQRLPRLIGPERALSAILRAANLTDADLDGTRLVDLWVDDESALIDAAVAFAASVSAAAPPRVRDLPLGDERTEALLVLARHDAGRRSPRPHIDHAVIAAMDAGRASFDAGSRAELRLFLELAGTPAAAAARHVFLAERRVMRAPGIDSAPAPSRVAVVGGGMMGRGIALALLRAGVQVALTDTDAATRDAAPERIRADAERGGDKDPGELLGQLEVVSSIDLFPAPEVVIEAVIEDADVKRSVFAAIEAAHPDAVIASNTSGLDLDELSRGLAAPSKLVGLHFFAPAQTMPVVEVVRTAAVSRPALATAVALARRLKKAPVLSAVGPGFIGNRIFDRYLHGALRLLADGYTPRAVDEALIAWGMRLGPFATLDLIGNDVVWDGRTEAQRDDAAWRRVGAMVERGALGRKSGGGWFDDETGAAPRASRGPRPEPDPAIIEGTIYPMIDEAVAVLADGIAQRPGDVDVLFLRGYGFPPDTGGPLWFADAAGLANVVRVLSRAGGTPHPLLVDLARTDGRIADWEERP